MFLIIGAVVGGGILAIPIVSIKIGFLPTLLLIILSWAIMTQTGLYILSMSLTCPPQYNSYYSIVGKFLGNKVKYITSILFLWLLYFSLASYISGCVSLIISHIKLTTSLYTHFNVSLVYVIIFGAIITISSRLIIRLNVLIVSTKLLLLCAVILCAHPITSGFTIGFLSPFNIGVLTVFGVINNAFGFQFIIPSLVSYYGYDCHFTLRKMLIASTTCVLILYLAWLYTIYALIPLSGEHSLISIYNSNNQLVAFNESLKTIMHSDWVAQTLTNFESIALFGSFICVSIGVFDFLVDACKTKDRLKVGCLTFLPPLAISLLSENMYLQAMYAASYISITLEIIIPIAARYKQKTVESLPAQV